MGIAENVLVRIGKFIFPIDLIILDIPEDDDVPLIPGAHSKIDVYKRKITLRFGEEKLVFKIIKPATSIIKRVFMLKDLDSKTKLIGEHNESFKTLYGNYIKLNDLDTPLEPETNQDVNFEPTFVNEPDNDAIRRILGFGIRRPCCKEIDDTVYSKKRRMLNSYEHSDASSTQFCSRTPMENHPEPFIRGVPRSNSIFHFL
ncbi:hypothetical protein Tco_1492852 [Tanacetum coccineum]